MKQLLDFVIEVLKYITVKEELGLCVCMKSLHCNCATLIMYGHLVFSLVQDIEKVGFG